ncbi:Pumilio RNA-binding region repeat containing protein [Theileria orientalis strain Shintoku]|uniref:Pumilio RNA-binding region repeat containing protein n=1 Tax=Theileria orientalis strain Shintoku TaxID=869250 RepID=J7MF32_THEOR|nr:Pumilio RNA-binding region repeat containing protein [Theileria orientalis strain Shintoku]BAM42399.1 Pumilio RNA-binding region repeat containing protein [Theileria orientalis strain Shintoku]|eukprot:XP_009692700.1 Pumilio RNA-binding region repeat containing protein [Theileria orientalis strain Shintoku]
MRYHDTVVYLNSLREKISQSLQESSNEDKFILASNVLSEINHYIPKLAADPNHSLVLEELFELLVMSLEDGGHFGEKRELGLKVLTNLLTSGEFANLAKETFGSHVLQTAINCVTSFVKFDKKFDTLLMHIANKIEEECLFELAHHVSGSYILRSIMSSLVNELYKKKAPTKKHVLEEVHVDKEKIPEWRKEKLFHWGTLFLKDMKSTSKTTQSSATFSLLVTLLHATDQLEKEDMLLSIIMETIPLLKNSKNTSYILQTIMPLCTNVEYTYIYNNLVVKDLENICNDLYLNYVVQSFIENSHFQKSHLEFMIENLNIKNLANSKSSSIAWKLCKACIDLYTCQEQFYKKLLDDFGVKEENRFWFVVTSAGRSDSEILLRPSGCSVLTYLVKFQKSVIGEAVSSFKHFLNHAVESGKFVEVCCDVYFSRVLQNVFDVRLALLPEKYVRKLLPVFEASLVELCLDIGGSHVLYGFFSLLRAQDKVALLSKMLDHYETIKSRNSKFARMVNLSEFKANRKLYIKKLEKNESVRELFKDIVG